MFGKISRDENFHAQEGGHHSFVELFLSHSTQNFRRGDPCVSEKFW